MSQNPRLPYLPRKRLRGIPLITRGLFVILHYDKSTKIKNLRLDISNSISDCPRIKHTVGSDFK